MLRPKPIDSRTIPKNAIAKSEARIWIPSHLSTPREHGLDVAGLLWFQEPGRGAGGAICPITVGAPYASIVVTHCGRICLGRKKINFSTVFAGQAVGIKEVQDDIWLVSFMDYDLGYFDLETRVLEPLENPFGPKVLPMS
jgi:hypothetical protein